MRKFIFFIIMISSFYPIAAEDFSKYIHNTNLSEETWHLLGSKDRPAGIKNTAVYTLEDRVITRTRLVTGELEERVEKDSLVVIDKEGNTFLSRSYVKTNLGIEVNNHIDINHNYLEESCSYDEIKELLEKYRFNDIVLQSGSFDVSGFKEAGQATYIIEGIENIPEEANQQVFRQDPLQRNSIDWYVVKTRPYKIKKVTSFVGEEQRKENLRKLNGLSARLTDKFFRSQFNIHGLIKEMKSLETENESFRFISPDFNASSALGKTKLFADVLTAAGIPVKILMGASFRPYGWVLEYGVSYYDGKHWMVISPSNNSTREDLNFITFLEYSPEEWINISLETLYNDFSEFTLKLSAESLNIRSRSIDDLKRRIAESDSIRENEFSPVGHSMRFSLPPDFYFDYSKIKMEELEQGNCYFTFKRVSLDIENQRVSPGAELTRLIKKKEKEIGKDADSLVVMAEDTPIFGNTEWINKRYQLTYSFEYKGEVIVKKVRASAFYSLHGSTLTILLFRYKERNENEYHTAYELFQKNIKITNKGA